MISKMYWMERIRELRTQKHGKIPNISILELIEEAVDMADNIKEE